MTFGKALDFSEPQSCHCKTGITNAFILELMTHSAHEIVVGEKKA